MTARNLLRTDDLESFRQYCLKEGYKDVDKTSVYEVLRMRKESAKGVLIAYRRKDEMYWLTVAGIAETLAMQFYAENATL